MTAQPLRSHNWFGRQDQSAASSHLLTHPGRAVVFEDHADLHHRIDDPALPVDGTSVLVLKQVGPKGAPGMPEWGAAPIPTSLLRKGVKDMVAAHDRGLGQDMLICVVTETRGDETTIVTVDKTSKIEKYLGGGKR